MSVVHQRGGRFSVRAWRGVIVCVTLALWAAAAPAAPARLLPEDYFGSAPVEAGAQMVINANTLTVDSGTSVVTAVGNVQIYYSGYALVADRIVYDQRAGSVELIGHVAVRDPEGNVFVTERARLTDDFKTGFLQSLVFETPSGERITADEAELTADMRMVFVNGVFSPCGECIDEKGRRIGWRLKAVRVVHDETEAVYYFERPSLELLGVPVAWLPFFVIPEVPDANVSRFLTPEVSFDRQRGVGLAIPYYWALDPNYSVTFAPTLFTRQGLMADVAFAHELEAGQYDIHGWAIYQFNPSAYAGEVGDRSWRGAIQSSGEFTPAEHWTLGWSATAFTDPGFLPDYGVGETEKVFAVNQLYASYLSTDLYKDVRVRQFLDLGDTSPAEQAGQGVELPKARYEQVVRLDGDRGEVRLSASVLGIARGADQTELVPPPGGPFEQVFGLEGNKLHASLEAGWTKQYVAPGGVLVAPYLGLRADAASYDGASSFVDAPPAGSLLALTPIAAVDMRWPLIGRTEGVTHLVEPIVQVVARGGSATTPGITNDDAQSFVFEDTNLFSFNRFSGFDRQETGVRAAWGVHYNAQFDGGGWLDAVFGKTYQIAGINSFALDPADDPTVPGVGEGLDEGPLSHFVIGATGSPGGGLTFGAKALIDPSPVAISRLALAATLDANRAKYGIDYSYIAPNPTIGVADPRHEIGGSATVPLGDYWSATGSLHWDLTAMSFAAATGGLDYDDGYLAYGVSATAYGPTSATSPDSQRIDFYLKLKPTSGFGGGLNFE